MDTYPYVQSPGRLVGFLKQLRTIGKPARFTVNRGVPGTGIEVPWTL